MNSMPFHCFCRVALCRPRKEGSIMMGASVTKLKAMWETVMASGNAKPTQHVAALRSMRGMLVLSSCSPTCGCTQTQLCNGPTVHNAMSVRQVLIMPSASKAGARAESHHTCPVSTCVRQRKLSGRVSYQAASADQYTHHQDDI